MTKMNRGLIMLAGVLMVCVLLLGAYDSTIAQEDGTPTPEYDPIDIYVLNIISEREHDPNAFTQGLLWYDGSFYESTGRRGQSTVREVDPESGQVIRSVDLDEAYFGEGLALVDDRLYQITWQAEQAFVYDLEDFTLLETVEYSGEGWGLCYDGEYLWMSDGSAVLVARDPETFEVVEEIEVFAFDVPITQLNELECVGDSIYANVWHTDVIYEIDKTTGQVTGLINATYLLTPAERAVLESQAVLNGIAYDPDEDVFYLTGKLWPKLFEVRFEQDGTLRYEDLRR